MPIARALKEANFQEYCIAKWTTTTTQKGKLICSSNFKYLNNELQDKECAAPLYDQVLEWLFKKGLYLHPYLMDGNAVELNTVTKPGWSCNILRKGTYKILWPKLLLSVRTNYKDYLHPTKQKAYDQAIMKALDLLQQKDKPKYHGNTK